MSWRWQYSGRPFRVECSSWSVCEGRLSWSFCEGSWRTRRNDDRIRFHLGLRGHCKETNQGGLPKSGEVLENENVVDHNTREQAHREKLVDHNTRGQSALKKTGMQAFSLELGAAMIVTAAAASFYPWAIACTHHRISLVPSLNQLSCRSLFFFSERPRSRKTVLLIKRKGQFFSPSRPDAVPNREIIASLWRRAAPTSGSVCLSVRTSAVSGETQSSSLACCTHSTVSCLLLHTTVRCLLLRRTVACWCTEHLLAAAHISTLLAAAHNSCWVMHRPVHSPLLQFIHLGGSLYIATCTRCGVLKEYIHIYKKN